MDVPRRFPELPLREVKVPRVVGEFRAFLTKSNALALAVGVIVGAATGKVVTSIVDDVLMPVIGLVLPRGDWREAKVVLSTATDANGKVTENAIRYGHILGSAVDFFLVAAVVFVIARALLRQPGTRPCPECQETVPAAAKRCRACTSPLPAP